MKRDCPACFGSGIRSIDPLTCTTVLCAACNGTGVSRQLPQKELAR